MSYQWQTAAPTIRYYKNGVEVYNYRCPYCGQFVAFSDTTHWCAERNISNTIVMQHQKSIDISSYPEDWFTRRMSEAFRRIAGYDGLYIEDD